MQTYLISELLSDNSVRNIAIWLSNYASNTKEV